MASTIRKLIQENVKTTIEGIASIKKVLLHEFDITKLETIPTPAVFLFPDTGDTVERGSRFEVWTLPLVVEVWGQDIEVEDIIGEIHYELMLDPKRGGNAQLTERMEGTDIMAYPGKNVSYVGLAMRFRITYRHVLNDPFSLEEDED